MPSLTRRSVMCQKQDELSAFWGLSLPTAIRQRSRSWCDLLLGYICHYSRLHARAGGTFTGWFPTVVFHVVTASLDPRSSSSSSKMTYGGPPKSPAFCLHFVSPALLSPFRLPKLRANPWDLLRILTNPVTGPPSISCSTLRLARASSPS